MHVRLNVAEIQRIQIMDSLNYTITKPGFFISKCSWYACWF